MRILHQRASVAFGVLFVALALSQTASAGMLLATVATVAVAGILVAHYASLVVGSRHQNVGRRADAHREALTSMPAPQHPATAGRPRTRAPSQSAVAA